MISGVPRMGWIFFKNAPEAQSPVTVAIGLIHIKGFSSSYPVAVLKNVPIPKFQPGKETVIQYR